MMNLPFGLRHNGIKLGILLLSLGLGLLLSFYPYQIRTEIINLKLPFSQNLAQNYAPSSAPPQIVGKLYIPPNTAAPYPTMILWHGVSSTKEMTEPLAIELARHGIAALTFDSGGFGESYRRNFSPEANIEDARVAFVYVKQHPQRFDPQRLGIGGHSMGAATAITFASYTLDASQIRATLALGMSAEVTPRRPANLLMGIGLYEEFHTPEAMIEMLQDATAISQPQAHQLYGNFTDGTARKLVISATSDHLMVPFDATIIREAVQWSRQAFALPEIPINLVIPWLMAGWLLTLIGVILTVGYGMGALAHKPWPPRLFSGAIVLITALILLLGSTKYISSQAATNLVLLQAIVLPVGNYALKHSQRLTRCFRLFALYVAAIIGAYTIMGIAITGKELLHQPSYLWSLPLFPPGILTALIYSRLQEFSAAMFLVYSNGLVPSWQLALLFLPELIYPSITLSWGTKAAKWLVQWLRQPLQIKWQIQWNASPNRRSLYLAAGLSVVLIVVLIQQFSLGLASAEYAITAMRILWHMALAPAILMICIIRSKYFQQLENKA